MPADMFLKIDTVKGDSIQVGHKDEIEILSWSWGMSQSGTMHSSTGGGSGKVHVNDLTLTKHVDPSSTVLIKQTCDGSHYKAADLYVRKAGGKAPIEYLKIHMEEVIVTAYTTGGSGGEDRVTENVTLNFARFKVDYTPQKPDGSAGAVQTVGWKIAEGQTWG